MALEMHEFPNPKVVGGLIGMSVSTSSVRDSAWMRLLNIPTPSTGLRLKESRTGNKEAR